MDYKLAKNRPDLTLTQLTRTRQLMDSHVLEAIVEGYEHRIDKLTLPDPDDRHVLAAAIESRSSLIITWNTTDFPDTHIDQYGVTAITPDEFILDQIELSPDMVSQAVRRHKDSLRNPAFTWREYFEMLERQGLTQSVELLRKLIPESKTEAQKRT